MSHKLTMLFDGDDNLFKDVLKTSKFLESMVVVHQLNGF